MTSKLKQAIVIRKDLKLKKSVVAALAAKASMEFIIDNNEDESGTFLKVELTPLEKEWLYGAGTRIILGAPSENALKKMQLKSDISGILCYAISETNNLGSEDLVCIALGPDESEKIDQLTGNLKLL